MVAVLGVATVGAFGGAIAWETPSLRKRLPERFQPTQTRLYAAWDDGNHLRQRLRQRHFEPASEQTMLDVSKWDGRVWAAIEAAAGPERANVLERGHGGRIASEPVLHHNDLDQRLMGRLELLAQFIHGTDRG
jgi:hypothetical protein